MAVTTVTTTMAGAINYTVVTDTSADWPSVANSTYFYDKADKLVHYKDGTGTIQEIFSAAGDSTTIPQTDILYVDAILGANDASAGRGNIDKPYATVEYLLANNTNTGTVTGDTTSGSTTISSVSDTTNIIVGQYITGTNIPYNSTVISKTSNTIVLSQKATGTGSTITLTWWTPKTIKINGDIVATSNWFKAGFWFDCGTSNITWGNFVLFNKVAATLIPEYISGGNWYGNNGSSQFMVSNFVSSAHDIFIDINQYLSIGTSTQISLYNAASFRNLIINCKNFDARFGSIASIQGTYVNWSGYKYGLLGGIISACTTLIVNDTIETPASVNALSGTNAYGIYNGNVRGSVNLGYYYDAVFNNSVIGTTFTARCDSLSCNGPVRVTTATINSGRGNATFSGEVTGTFTCSGYNEFLSFGGNFVSSGGKHIITLNAGYYGGTSSITTSGTAEVYLNGTIYGGTYNYVSINLGLGSTIYNSARMKMQFVGNNAGTFINRGDIALQYAQLALTGTFENYGTVELVRPGQSDSAIYTPVFIVSTGTLVLHGGEFFCNVADSKSGLIRKTASGGKVILKGQPYLKVANGLAPLQILSNTGTAQDILDFSMVGNGAVGFRLADTFSDTTYGTAYAPNLLVGGTRYEDTTNSF